MKVRVRWGLIFSVMACYGLLSTSSLCQDKSQASPPPSPKRSKSALKKKPVDTFTLVGAGDIAGCSDLSGAEATAKLLDHIPGTVFANGDLAYEHGSDEEFRNCYGPTWGRFKSRTRPSPGNHEYNGNEALGYFRYWGEQAGTFEKGYYSYDLGSWHVV